MTIQSQTLYRKYRPQSFDQIIGQSEVVQTLQNSIQSQTLAHAYLFSGGRGTGKTSIARIFAREIGTVDADLYEIDAASNRGIGEIRELKEGIETLPFSSPQKVYIIDEVHMLTKEAFNALLKVLEEPPTHVIFILATTEKHKVLDTILSRCQVFDFKLAIHDSLTQLIQQVATEEGRVVDGAAGDFVARLGGGSFRDTLSHLQKVFGAVEGDVTLDKVQQLFSSSDDALENDFVAALAAGDKEALAASYAKVLAQDVEVKTFAEHVLEKIRIALLLKHGKDFQTLYAKRMAPAELDFLAGLSGLNAGHLKKFLQVLEYTGMSARPEVAFEMFLHEIL